PALGEELLMRLGANVSLRNLVRDPHAETLLDQIDVLRADGVVEGARGVRAGAPALADHRFAQAAAEAIRKRIDSLVEPAVSADSAALLRSVHRSRAPHGGGAVTARAPVLSSTMTSRRRSNLRSVPNGPSPAAKSMQDTRQTARKQANGMALRTRVGTDAGMA